MGNSDYSSQSMKSRKQQISRVYINRITIGLLPPGRSKKLILMDNLLAPPSIENSPEKWTAEEMQLDYEDK